MTSTRSFFLGTLATLSAASIGLAGCGSDAAEPADAQARVQALLPGLVSSTSNALAGSDGIPAIAWLDQGMVSLETAFPQLADMIPGTGTDDEAEPVLTIAALADEGDDAGNELAALLAQQIFSEQNYEGDGYYLLPGEFLCASTGDLDEAGEVDATCVADADRAEIRIHASLVGEDGIDLGLAIGPDRDEPLQLELRPARLSLVFDLAAAKNAVAHLAGDEAALPQVMEGVLALSLIVHGQDDISIEAATRTALRIEAALPDMPAPFRFSTAAKDPLLAVRAQGTTQMELSFDLGRTELSMPWNLSEDGGAGDDVLAVVLAGMSASTTLRADATEAVISNIGLGDGTSSIKLDDHTLFAIDLNADLGRRFDLTVRPSDTGLPTFTLSPGFDLSMAFDLAPLVEAGEVPAEELISETYRISLTGDEPTLQPVDADFESGFSGGIQVSSGTLTISSSSANEPLVIEPGVCLIEVAAEPDADPILGTLATAACP